MSKAVDSAKEADALISPRFTVEKSYFPILFKNVKVTVQGKAIEYVNNNNIKKRNDVRNMPALKKNNKITNRKTIKRSNNKKANSKFDYYKQYTEKLRLKKEPSN